MYVLIETTETPVGIETRLVGAYKMRFQAERALESCYRNQKSSDIITNPHAEWERDDHEEDFAALKQEGYADLHIWYVFKAEV